MDDVPFALADLVHVHRRTIDSHAIGRRSTHQVRHLGTSDHVLAWQAGDVWTRASNQGPFDHNDGPALLGQFPGQVLAGLAAAEDDILDIYDLSHREAFRL